MSSASESGPRRLVSLPSESVSSHGGPAGGRCGRAVSSPLPPPVPMGSQVAPWRSELCEVIELLRRLPRVGPPPRLDRRRCGRRGFHGAPAVIGTTRGSRAAQGGAGIPLRSRRRPRRDGEALLAPGGRLPSFRGPIGIRRVLTVNSASWGSFWGGSRCWRRSSFWRRLQWDVRPRYRPGVARRRPAPSSGSSSTTR